MAANKIARRLLDKRVAHRYITEGIINQNDWDTHIDGLPDNADQSEIIDFRPGDEARTEEPAPEEIDDDSDDSLDI